jgi:hypothetical protein
MHVPNDGRKRPELVRARVEQAPQRGNLRLSPCQAGGDRAPRYFVPSWHDAVTLRSDAPGQRPQERTGVRRRHVVRAPKRGWLVAFILTNVSVSMFLELRVFPELHALRAAAVMCGVSPPTPITAATRAARLGAP